jgi:hypothetical protein
MGYEIGEEVFDEAKMLEWLYKFMKTYPNVTARDILWSLFVPNDKSMIEAQERGRPENVTEVISQVLQGSQNREIIERDITPVETLGVYKLQLIDQKKFFKANKNYPHTTVMVVIAENHGDARRLCVERSGQYSDGSRKHSKDWANTSKCTCTLLAKITERLVWRQVIFAGRHCPDNNDWD